MRNGKIVSLDPPKLFLYGICMLGQWIGCVHLSFYSHSLVIDSFSPECPINAIRLINSQDIATSYVASGGNFTFLLSSSPKLSDGYFSSSDVPNKGSFTFSEPFVLVNLTTQGYIFLGDESYVSEFILQYASSSDAPYQNYLTVRPTK